VKLPLTTDQTAFLQYEILVGVTNRVESQNTGMQKIDYSAKVVGDKLVFSAGHYYGLVFAVDNFIAQYETVVNNAKLTETYAASGQIDQNQVNLSWTNTGAAAARFPGNNFDALTKGEENNVFSLVWNDEFNGTVEEQINYAKWTGATVGTTVVNTYCDMAPEVICQDGQGNMVLTTYIWDKENQCIDYDESTWVEGSTDNWYYTAKGLHSYSTMNWIYGYLEMRAKVPSYGVGEWPSFYSQTNTAHLFLSAHSKEHGFSLESVRKYWIEVDFFEVFSSSTYLETKIHKWYLNSAGEGRDSSNPSTYQYEPYNIAEVYHTYGFLWTKDLMSCSVDGQFYWGHNLDKLIGRAGMEGFGGYVYDDDGNEIYNNLTQAMALIIGAGSFTEAYAESPLGEWAGRLAKNDKNGFPYAYTIDYVRLYQIDGYDMRLYTTQGLDFANRV
jgi:hypothetical protein